MKQFAGSQRLLLSSAGLSLPPVTVSRLRHGALPPGGVPTAQEVCARLCLGIFPCPKDISLLLLPAASTVGRMAMRAVLSRLT